MTESIPEPPSAEYGCFDCDLPTFQDDLVAWLIILSPFLVTVMISTFFVRRAENPIGILQLIAISVPGALPTAFAVFMVTDDSMSEKIGLGALLVLLWSVTFGPAVVFFTQWIYLEYCAFRRRQQK